MDVFAKKALLTELYGVEFPDSLFHLHAFFAGLTRKEAKAAWDALGMRPCGLMEVLALPTAALKKLRPRLPMILHCRFYRDPPEFFTCLFGYCDGHHWGLLLDDPQEGFKGAASFYNNDGDNIVEHGGLFDAVLDELDSYLEDVEEMIEECPEDEALHRRNEAILTQLSEKLLGYVEAHELPVVEGREEGVASDTGLSVIVPGGGRRKAPTVFSDHRFRPADEIEKERKKALAACKANKPLAALALGRSLHYWGGEDWSAAAYELLREAYATLGRDQLVKILDTHYEHRDLGNVDIINR